MFRKIFLCLTLSLVSFLSYSQMRQIYSNLSTPNDIIKKISFYSPSQGYIASTGNSFDWVGYTADSGRTFIKREITLANVDYNGYSVNLTFGFSINGVVAFDQNNLIVYGDYGLVPAILKSDNGGLSYLLVHHQQIGPTTFSSLFHVVFPQTNQTGYAADGFNIYKTSNGGTTWTRVYAGSTFSIAQIDALDNTTVYAFSDDESGTAPTGKLIKTTNAGLTWTQVTIPDFRLYAADFITPDKGWINVYPNTDSLLVYYTSNGGVNWTKKNVASVNPIGMQKMKFINDSTGYAITYLFNTYKTSDSGRVWEPLPRDNNFSYLNYGHYDLFFINNNQFWAGGARDFLEITTNAGGTPLPKAYWKIDTAGFYHTNTVKLFSYSKPAYSHKWYRNNVLISTAYNASYQRDPASNHDSIKLVVNNGILSDSLTIHQYFWPPVSISSFTPQTGGAGAVITITGQNFTNVQAVRFGNVPAASVTVVSPTTINATVSTGSSGYVKVLTVNGQDSLPGFTFIPPPTISTFNPASAAAGTTVTINGTNFTGTTTVLMGGIPASYTVISPTQITAIAPSGPSGSISVTTPGGTATITGYSSLPTISSFTPDKGTHGTIMTITGTSLNGTTAVSVGGINVVSFTVNSSSTITAIVGPGSSGAVQVTRPEGISSLPGFTWLPPPVINSVSPLSGPVGTSVTITGTGFHTTQAGNTVYFGATRAVITAASATSLTVTVPYGAGYTPITVSANNLTSHSSQPFLVTFAGGGSITQSSFTMASQLTNGNEVLPFGTGAADFDGDGRTELIMLKLNNPGSVHGVLIYPNTGTGGAISFGTAVELPGSYESFATGDIDGDGKTDIVIAASPNLLTYINTSVPGTVSFAPAVTTTTGLANARVRITDADMDGKNDLVFGSGGNMYVVRNTSEPGDIKFATAEIIYNTIFERNFVPMDLTGDRKPELVISGFGVLKNNSTPGVLNFSMSASLPPYNHSYIALGDIDGDGKQDVVSADHYGSQLSIMRNTGTGSTISFADPVSYSAASLPASLIVGDLDGDGKPDVALAQYENVLTVFKNISTPGNISMLAQKNYFPGAYGTENQIALADFNNDGKYDITVSCEVQRKVYVLRNEVKAEPSVQSFTPTIGENGTSVTISGANFTGTTAVRFGGVAAASFTVNSSSSITAIVGSGATGHVSVFNSTGSDSLNGFVYGYPPVITSVSPLKGTVGTPVTITGSGFSTIPEDNIIYFGGVKSRAVTATATSLTVYVPPGSVYAPVSVTRNRLTAWSAKPFLTTFPNGSSTLTAHSFANRIDIGNMPAGCLVDFDGDGKLDIAGSWSSTAIAVARNTGVPGQISFAPAAVISGTEGGGGMISEDFDGDGKKDLAFIQSNTQVMLVRNNSTPGYVAASGIYSFPTGSHSNSAYLSASDIDGDGKPELLIANYSGRIISILKNNSSASAINFSARFDYPLSTYGNGIKAADVDDDGKPDILALAGELSVFRNLSTPGNFNLAPRVSFPANDWPSYLTTGDLDGDGRLDALVSNVGSDGISVFLNGSSSGNISFSSLPEIPAGDMPYGNGINDLSGDGKPDLFVPSLADSLSLFANTSSIGSLSFAPRITLETGNDPFRVESGDLDGDGRPDIIVFGGGAPATVFRNQHGGPGPRLNSFSPVSGLSGTVVTISGEGFTGISNVTFGGVSAASFTVISSSIIEAVLGPGASGPVTVHSNTGIASLPGFVYGNKPVIASFLPASATAGTTVTITGANFTGATAVYFGNTAAASFNVNSAGTITAVTGSGTTGLVKVVSATGADSLGTFTYLRTPTISSFTPQTGNSGSTVTITGTGFTAVTSVRFGGVAAWNFTINSETSITATVGDGNTGKLEVSGPGGTAVADGFLYNNGAIISTFFPKSAASGNRVYLYGHNMGSVTAVKFGGVAASSFVIESPTRIAALVGAGASGDISVTNQVTTTSINGFTFLNPGVPSITSIAPLTGTTGSLVTITGQQLTGVTEVRFGATVAAGFTVVSDSLIIATVGSGSSGTVTVLAPAGNSTFPGFIYTSAPVITSFSPLSAAPETSVTITGQNFSSSPSGNTVYFGTVKATVTAASSSSLTVTVPYGASLSPVTVTTNGRTAYSVKDFIPSFNGSADISPTAFIRSVDSGSYKRPSALAIGDLNLDNKPDVVVCNPSGSTLLSNLTFYTNASAAPNIGFAPRSTVQTVYGPMSAVYADFNNDGKPDILSTAGSTGLEFTLLPNNSNGGPLSFGTTQAFTGYYELRKCLAADFDKDGRTDVCMMSEYGSAVSVFRNTGTGTGFNFGARQTFPAFTYTTDIFITDIDGDGKPDILIAGGSNIPELAILKNTSTENSITFQASTLTLPWSSRQVTAGDLDNDGKPDVVVTNSAANELVVLKNQSFPGYFSLETTLRLPIQNPGSPVLADISGDGKPDLLLADIYSNYVYALSNRSAVTGIAFDRPVSFFVNNPGGALAVCDMDADGRPELIRTNGYSNSISIMQNKQPAYDITNVAVCANGGTSLSAGITGSSYQWQQDNGNGYVNISNNSNFSGVSTATLQLSAIPSSWNNYRYRCVVNGTQFGTIYRLSVTPAVLPVILITGTTTLNAGQSSSLVSVMVNGGSAPSYQWQDSTASAGWQNIGGATGSTLNYTPAANGVKIRCMLTSNANCASPQSVNSNVLTFTVSPVTAIDPVPASQFSIRHYPNPANEILIIDSLRLADQWETLRLLSSNGVYIQQTGISGRTRVELPVAHLSAGTYIVILESRKKKRTWLLFVKQ